LCSILFFGDSAAAVNHINHHEFLEFRANHFDKARFLELNRVRQEIDQNLHHPVPIIKDFRIVHIEDFDLEGQRILVDIEPADLRGFFDDLMDIEFLRVDFELILLDFFIVKEITNKVTLQLISGYDLVCKVNDLGDI
jgi:hypothetical protein